NGVDVACSCSVRLESIPAADESYGKSRFVVHKLERLDSGKPGDESASAINFYARGDNGICSRLPRILASIPLCTSGEPWIAHSGKYTGSRSWQRRSDRTDLPEASSNKAAGDCADVGPAR